MSMSMSMRVRSSTVSIRPYQYECTRNHQNSEVKRAWASLVLGWGTTREPLVLYAFFILFYFASHVHVHMHVQCRYISDSMTLLAAADREDNILLHIHLLFLGLMTVLVS
jgi:hypothetical protein